MAFNIGWALIGRALLLAPISPVAIGIVWLLGYVWGVAYIATDGRTADYLLKIWLGYLAVVSTFAGFVVFIGTA